MKLFITGSKGQLGYDCQLVMGGQHELRAMDLPDLDITQPASVELALNGFQPDVIVNCAAYTGVDSAENYRDTARGVNAAGPGILARWTAQHGARLIHISTDYVFDGLRPPPQPYTEADAPAPACVYGVTKLDGELAVRESGARHAILRTAWLYGINGHNFLRTILRAALKKTGKPLKVVNDQHGSPTWSYRLATQIAKAIEADGEGLYHATAHGHCTWYDLAVHFLRAMDVSCEILPCPTSAYPLPARRPANSILENVRLKEQGIDIMADWNTDVDEFVRRFHDRLLREATANT